jgi:hypothetical protein
MLYTVASCESGPAAELVLERMRFATSFCVSSRGSVAVIDGPLLAVTPLQHTVIPPPFAAARLAAGSAVVAAAWGEREGCEVVAAVTVTGELRVSVAVEEDFWEETVEGAVGSTGVTQDLNPPIQVCPGLKLMPAPAPLCVFCDACLCHFCRAPSQASTHRWL